MHIRYIGHAGIALDVAGQHLLCDPWWNGPAYTGQWQAYPLPRVEKADLEEHEMEFLYASGDEFHFMNTDTYEQVGITREDLGQAVDYLVPNTKVMVEFYEHRPVGVELPVTVDLRVVETQPGMKGATASNSGKPAVLETGLQVMVPQFIDVGELVRIDTAEGTYLERAK